MKTFVVTQITIASHPSKVFDYLMDLKYHHLWNPQLQSITPIKKLSLGEEYETSSMVLGIKIRAKNVVSKFVSMQELEIQNNTGLVKYRASFKVRPSGNESVVICKTIVSADGEAFAFAKPILKVLARRELQTDMQALKIAVENQLK